LAASSAAALALAAASSFLFYYASSNGFAFLALSFSTNFLNGFSILTFSSLAFYDTNLDLS
jgi:hypothetical protein